MEVARLSIDTRAPVKNLVSKNLNWKKILNTELPKVQLQENSGKLEETN